MKKLNQLLKEAYDLINDAPTNDIDLFYCSVKQAQMLIAEALDLCGSVDLIGENAALRRQLISACNALMEKR